MGSIYLVELPNGALVGEEESDKVLVLADSALQARRTVVRCMLSEMNETYADSDEMESDCYGVDFGTFWEGLKATALGASLSNTTQHTLSSASFEVLTRDPRATYSLARKPAVEATMFDYTFMPTESCAAAEVANLLQQQAGHISNIPMGDYAAKAKAMAKVLGYNHSQRNRTSPQCSLGWTRMVEALSVKITTLNWPCAAKETLLADLRLLPYGRNMHTWELDFVPGNNQRAFRVAIRRT